MSILSVANVWFESTGSNRIDYVTGNNLLRIVATGGVALPAGTTAARPTANVVGTLRYNTDTDAYELYKSAGQWATLSGATGGANDKIFWENGINVTANYTITTGFNAGTFGPITINDNVSITIPDGSSWTVT